MDHDEATLPPRDQRLDEIVTAYLMAVEAGEHPVDVRDHGRR